MLFKIFSKSPLTFSIYARTKTPQLQYSTKYIQGQVTENNIREYFYFIDHQGQLFLDDAKMKNFTSCFKEKDFLRFFFKRLKLDKELKYPDFPYISPCGPEMNYIKCDDIPIVFTKVLTIDNETILSYNNGEDKLTFPFNPELVCMEPSTGRVYHSAPSKAGGVGLVKSSIAIEWSKYFHYYAGAHEDQDPPTHFTWEGQTYTLTNELFDKVQAISVLKDHHSNESI